MTPAPPAQSEGDAGVPHSKPPKTTLKRVLFAFLPITVLTVLIMSDFPLCPSKNLFGVPCPGCGMTRATEAMLTGDFWTMLRMHPLAPIIAPVAVFSFARATLVSAGLIASTSRDPLGKIPNPVWAVVGIALIGLWVVRMFGLLGGLPDPIDFTDGWIAQGFTWVWNLFG